MVEINEITGRDSLKAWLLALPETRGDARAREIAAIIAARAALRVFPVLWGIAARSTAGKQLWELRALQGIRYLCVSAACRTYAHSTNIRSAARAADADADAAGAFAVAISADADADADADTADTADSAFAADAADAVAFAAAAAAAAYAAARAADADAVAFAAAAAAAAYAAARAAAGALWREIRHDAQNLLERETLDTAPLWHAENPFASNWAAAKAKLDPDLWSFWMDAYERILNGKGLRRAVMQEIFKIPEDDWKQGPAHIAAMISAIEKKLKLATDQLDKAIEHTPIGERIDFNAATGRFYSTLYEANIGHDVLDQLGAVLEEWDAQKNTPSYQQEYKALTPLLERLQKGVDKHPQNPVRLYQIIKKTLRELHGYCEVGSLPPLSGKGRDVALDSFAEELVTSRISLLEIKEVQTYDAHQVNTRIKEAGIDRNALAEILDKASAQSQGQLRNDLIDNADVLKNPASSKEAVDEALYVGMGRLVRLSRAAENIATKTAEMLTALDGIINSSLFQLIFEIFTK